MDICEKRQEATDKVVESSQGVSEGSTQVVRSGLGSGRWTGRAHPGRGGSRCKDRCEVLGADGREEQRTVKGITKPATVGSSTGREQSSTDLLLSLEGTL